MRDVVVTGVVQHDGFAQLSEPAFLEHFANGVERSQARALYAEQQPIAATLFSGRTTVAAWHTKPSWYAVSKQDHTIAPELQRFLARRMKATTIEVDAGHLSLVSRPQEIADLIIAAARGSQPAPHAAAAP
jgi:pimeloyl-ACP methyl ester carboxylesterase